MKVRFRTGFTLVELLVVIAIIGILIALLLPAVQAAREAARRSQCTNNLKQLGIAMHNYHDSFKSFPSGYIQHVPAVDNEGHWAWSAFILPYVEQAPLHDQLKVGTVPVSVAMLTPALLDAMQTPLAAFRCPSAAGQPDIHDEPGRRIKANGGSESGLAVTNYITNNSTFGLKKPGGTDPYTQALGVFYRHSKVAFRDITDGSSNVILVGERAYILNNVKAFAGALFATRDANGTGPYNSSSGSASNQGLISIFGGGAAVINAAATSGQGRIAYSSNHPGGANFCLCDGSVRFLSETIHANVATIPVDSTYEYLMGIADGNVVGDF